MSTEPVLFAPMTARRGLGTVRLALYVILAAGVSWNVTERERDVSVKMPNRIVVH